MKSVYALFLATLVLGLFANCAKHDDTATGTTEMSAACAQNAQLCNSSVYNSAQGFSSSQYGGYASSGGTMYPVYSATKGVGYVLGNYIMQNGTPAQYAYSNGVFVPASQGSVLRACDSSDLCPSQQYCRSPFGNVIQSSIGICYY